MSVYSLDARKVGLTISVENVTIEGVERLVLMLRFHYMGNARRDGRYFHWVLLGFLAGGWYAGIFGSDIVVTMPLPPPYTVRPRGQSLLCDVALANAELRPLHRDNVMTVSFQPPMEGLDSEDVLREVLPTSLFSPDCIVLAIPITRVVDGLAYLDAVQHGRMLHPPPLPDVVASEATMT